MKIHRDKSRLACLGKGRVACLGLGKWVGKELKEERSEFPLGG